MSNDFQPTLSRLPIWLRSADDTAETAPAGVKDIRPVFADPSGYRRVLVRGTAATLAAAGIAFMAGAGLLLSNQSSPAAPYNIDGSKSAGGSNGRVLAAPPAAGAMGSLPRGVFTPVRPASGQDAAASGSTSPVALRPAVQPGVRPGSDSAASAGTLPAVGASADAVTRPAAGPPPATGPPPVMDPPPVADPPPAVDPPPAEEPGPLSPVIDPLTTVVGTLLGPLL